MHQDENFYWHVDKCKLYFTSHGEVWRITSTKCFCGAECELVREWEKYARGRYQGMETISVIWGKRPGQGALQWKHRGENINKSTESKYVYQVLCVRKKSYN